MNLCLGSTGVEHPAWTSGCWLDPAPASPGQPSASKRVSSSDKTLVLVIWDPPVPARLAAPGIRLMKRRRTPSQRPWHNKHLAAGDDPGVQIARMGAGAAPMFWRCSATRRHLAPEIAPVGFIPASPRLAPYLIISSRFTETPAWPSADAYILPRLEPGHGPRRHRSATLRAEDPRLCSIPSGQGGRLIPR